MNKVIPLLAFSILLLVPVGLENAFATHPVCPTGTSSTPPFTVFGLCVPGPNGFFVGDKQCWCDPNNLLPECEVVGTLQPVTGGPIQGTCVADPNLQLIRDTQTTLPEQCADNAILDPITNHCVPDFGAICTGGSVQSGITCIAQAMNNIVGGVLLETNTLPLLVGAIGVNPIITGLVGISLAGIVGQTAWFVYRRKKSKNYLNY